jgi:hypothetical protein
MMRRTLLPLVALVICLQTAARAHGDAAPPQPGASEGGAEAAPAQPESPLHVTTRVEPAAVTIGTPLRFTVRVEADPSVEIVMPVVAGRIGDLVINDFGRRSEQPSSPGAPAVVEAWYELVGYVPGTYTLPALPVGYRVHDGEVHEVESPAATAEITSLLAQSKDASDVRDIKDAIPIREPLIAPWMLAAAGGAVVLALGVLLVLRRRKKRASASIARPAHEIALEALAVLNAERLIEFGRYEDYYVRLSSIVRQYLEGRFGVRAPEMTTDEFLAAAQRSRDLAAPDRQSLQEFLSEADLVKFARHVPTRERAERAWTAARAFVESTRPRSEEAESAAA